MGGSRSTAANNKSSSKIQDGKTALYGLRHGPSRPPALDSRPRVDALNEGEQTTRADNAHPRRENVGGMHRHAQQPAERIDENVALATRDLLARIKRSAGSGLHPYPFSGRRHRRCRWKRCAGRGAHLGACRASPSGGWRTLSLASRQASARASRYFVRAGPNEVLAHEAADLLSDAHLPGGSGRKSAPLFGGFAVQSGADPDSSGGRFFDSHYYARVVLLRFFLSLFVSLFKSKSRLEAENTALRFS
jgi:hypothetical protein